MSAFPQTNKEHTQSPDPLGGQRRDGGRRLDGTHSPASVAVRGATAVRRTPVSSCNLLRPMLRPMRP
jgi:hypothetical protein